MSTPPAGIPETDWLAKASVRTLILTQQEEIKALRQENDELRCQLTAPGDRTGQPARADWPELPQLLLAARLLRRSSRPPVAGLALSRQSGARAVAASGADKQAIPDPDQSCCRSSGWKRWWITTLMRAATAVSCWTVLIQIHCVIR